MKQAPGTYLHLPTSRPLIKSSQQVIVHPLFSCPPCFVDRYGWAPGTKRTDPLLSLFKHSNCEANVLLSVSFSFPYLVTCLCKQVPPPQGLASCVCCHTYFVALTSLTLIKCPVALVFLVMSAKAVRLSIIDRAAGYENPLYVQQNHAVRTSNDKRVKKKRRGRVKGS